MKGKLLFIVFLFLLAVTDLKGEGKDSIPHFSVGQKTVYSFIIQDSPARGGQNAETFWHSAGYQLRFGQINKRLVSKCKNDPQHRNFLVLKSVICMNVFIRY